MIKKELEELRKRLTLSETKITHIQGCYVNSNREIISTFRQSLKTEMEEAAADRLLQYLKKVLSGTPKIQQLEILFRTEQVAKSEPCHKLLMDLRDRELRDEELCQTLYEKIASSFDYTTAGGKAGNYMVLMAYESYDLPMKRRGRKKAEEESEWDPAPFQYILCAICPAKEPRKGLLNYSIRDHKFTEPIVDWLVDGPLAGFIFPAFDHRTNNIYMAGFYTKEPSEIHENLLRTLFDIQAAPVSAEDQKKQFGSALKNALEESCNLDTYYKLTDYLKVLEEEKKQEGISPLTMNKDTLATVMTTIGVDQEKVYSFLHQYDELIGPDSTFVPRAVLDLDKVELEADEVEIICRPNQKRKISTRTIDGKKCVVIEIESGVMVNGLPLVIE